MSSHPKLHIFLHYIFTSKGDLKGLSFAIFKIVFSCLLLLLLFFFAECVSIGYVRLLGVPYPIYIAYI